MKWGKKSRWKYRHGVGKKKKDPSSEVKIPSADILFMGKVVGGTYLYLPIMLEEK